MKAAEFSNRLGLRTYSAAMKEALIESVETGKLNDAAWVNTINVSQAFGCGTWDKHEGVGCGYFLVGISGRMLPE